MAYQSKKSYQTDQAYKDLNMRSANYSQQERWTGHPGMRMQDQVQNKFVNPSVQHG